MHNFTENPGNWLILRKKGAIWLGREEGLKEADIALSIFGNISDNEGRKFILEQIKAFSELK